MPHFTYDDTFKPEDDLEQGDIIERTPELLGVLGKAHKHVLDEKYLAFIVLTQSCDMVRRPSKPWKPRYINLAVVLPLDEILPALLDSVCEKAVVCGNAADGLYLKKSRFLAKNLLSRIIHQNEQGQGIFYLHPDTQAGIAVPSVALLQISISLGREDYKALMKARMGRLTKVFQTRLGWLIGNLYSRAATPDWKPEQSKKIIKSALATQSSTRQSYWVSREYVQEAEKQNIVTTGKDASEIAKMLANLRPTPPIETALDCTVRVVREVIGGASEQDMEKIKGRLLNDQMYELTFRRH